MVLQKFFNKTDIDAGVEKFLAAPYAVLLDVRTPDEYREGHIPGSQNIPIDDIRAALNLIPNRDTPIFVHCRSGMRSARAARSLKALGYTNVTNIGGVLNYHGALEKN